jgi:hypothetical protein
MKFIIYINLLIIIVSCNKDTNIRREHEAVENKIEWDGNVYAINNHEWGYDIFKNEQHIIHQDQVPGVPGKNGFKSKLGAE